MIKNDCAITNDKNSENFTGKKAGTIFRIYYDVCIYVYKIPVSVFSEIPSQKWGNSGKVLQKYLLQKVCIP